MTIRCLASLVLLALVGCGKATPGLIDSPDAAVGSGDAAAIDGATDGAMGADASPPTGDGLWQRHESGSATANLLALAADTDGSVVAVGFFEGAADFGSGFLSSRGDKDAFVVKYDASGTALWARSFGGACGADQATRVAIGADHAIYVYGTATFSSPGCDPVFGGSRIPTTFTGSGTSTLLVLARYAADGTESWARSYGSLNAQLAAHGMSLHGDALALTGASSMDVDFGGGASVSQATHSFLAVVAAADGTGRWARGFTGSLELPGVATDDAQVVVGATFNSTVDLGAPVTVPVFGSGDVAMAAYDLGTGAYRWHQHLGGLDADYATAVTRVPDGSFWLTGYFWGAAHFGGATLTATSGDGFAARFAADGQPIVSIATGESAQEMLVGGAGYDDGGIVLTGEIGNGLGIAAVVTRLDGNGAALWRHVLGTTGSAATAAAVGPTGEIVVGGTVSGTLTVPSLPPMTSSGAGMGYADAFVVRFAP